MSLRSYIEDYFSLGDLYLFCAFVIVVTFIGFELDIPSALIDAMNSRDRDHVSEGRSSATDHQGMRLSVDGVANGQGDVSVYTRSALLEAHDDLLRSLHSDPGASPDAFRHKVSATLNATQSATGHLIDDLRVQLEGEQARSHELETELVRTRAGMARPARFPPSPDATAASMQASSAVSETALRARDEQIAAVIAERDAAKQSAAAQVTELQDRLERTTAQLSSSDHDLAALRGQMAQVVLQKDGDQAAADEKERSRQAVLSRQTADSSNELRKVQQTAAAQVADLQGRLEHATAQLSSSDHDLAALREQMAQAVLQKIADQAAADERERSRQDVLSRQTADSSNKLKEVQQAAAAQITELQDKLQRATAQLSSSDHDLAALREQVAQAVLQKAAADDKERGRQDMLSRQSADSSNKLKEVQKAAAAQVADLQGRLEHATAQLSSSDHDLAALREQMAQTVLQKTADQAAADKERSREEVLSRQTADSSDKLKEVQQAAAAQVAELQDKLQRATARLSSSDHDLATLREQMAQAVLQKTADQAAADESKQSRQSADSSNQLKEAQQAAAAQMAELQDKLQRATAQLSSSDHDLAALREQVAKAALQKTADQAAADKERSRQDLLSRRVADSSNRLKEAQKAAADQIADLTVQLSTAQSRSDGLDRDLAAARQQLAQAGQDKSGREAAQDFKGKVADLQARLDAAEARSTALSRSLADARAAGGSGPAPKIAEVTGPVKEAALPPTAPVQDAPPQSRAQPLPISVAPPPANVPARVTLRYARNSETARGKAAALRLDLQSKGLAVADPIAASKGSPAISVTYYYSEDREAAASMASLISASGPVQRRLRAEDPLPPPGTVEVDFGS